MKTPLLTEEYQQLETRYHEVKALLASKSDSNLIQELCDNVRRRRQIAMEVFGESAEVKP